MDEKNLREQLEIDIKLELIKEHKCCTESILCIETYMYRLEQENANLKQKLQQRDEVIEEAIEFLKEFHNYENRFKWCEQNYIAIIEKIEEILTKYKGYNKGDNNDK